MRTLDAKNHQTFTCNQMQLEWKVRNWEISPTCDSPPQLTIAPPIPCLVRKTTHQLHQLAHPQYAQYACACGGHIRLYGLDIEDIDR